MTWGSQGGEPASDQQYAERPDAVDGGLGFTPLQGQYLAFIASYTTVNGRPQAEADVRTVLPGDAPSVHNMIVSLERHGLPSGENRDRRAQSRFWCRARIYLRSQANKSPSRSRTATEHKQGAPVDGKDNRCGRR